MPFYASRTLPNTLALVLTNLGLSFWLRANSSGGGATAGAGQQRQRQRTPAVAAIALLTAAAVVFRGDVLLLLAPAGLQLLIARRIGVAAGLGVGAAAAGASLAATVAVDSLFWRRWLWPEGEVLWFNTVLNK